MDDQMKLLGEITYDICERWHMNKNMTHEDSAPEIIHLSDGEKIELLALLFCSDEDWGLDENYAMLLSQVCSLMVESRRKALKPILNTAIFIELMEVYTEKANKYLDLAWDDYCSDNFSNNALRQKRAEYIANQEIEKRLINNKH